MFGQAPGGDRRLDINQKVRRLGSRAVLAVLALTHVQNEAKGLCTISG